MYYITYNGISNKTLRAEVAVRPSIPAPTQRGDYIQIAGRDGSLLDTDGTYENIEIEIEMNLVSTRRSLWNTDMRQIKAWLKGSGELRFSDDPDIFYKVKACGIGDIERRTYRGGDFTAVFVCDPYAYYVAGAKPMTPEEASLNPYELCKPIYRLTGNGTATLTVNGNTMTAVVSDNLTIDTEKMLAYTENMQLQNTSVTGDYEALWLPSGVNSITVSNGFALTVQPNYRSL